MSVIHQNLQAVHAAIATAAQQAGREPQSIALLAVSKGCTPAQLIEATQAGQRAFGENYLQEALDKMDALADFAQLEWHFIGPIQSNKTRAIAERFDWVHSVEREKIALRLAAQRPMHLPPLNVCLQINISNESSKAGAMPESALQLAQAVEQLPQLRLRGLMAIPEALDAAATEVQRRAPFKALRELFEQLRAAGLELDTLSMGMSADLALAIAEGANIVRIGTAIFGARSTQSLRMATS